eukprot:gnl/Chilomastix_cuspidata/532.p1 GENE.gnl/Chilomastix_cuspidata/532~~gnl/Chilomastix_cuspidata/532.p1  ORF type:complete len:376 (+),score=135.85 gnl/Chilomastix_cuspidata/532:33-1160(+)
MHHARLAYLAFVAFWFVLACLFYFWLGDLMADASWLDWITLFKELSSTSDKASAGYYLASRNITMLFFFHAVMALLMLGAECGSPRAFATIHRKGTGWKFLAQVVFWFILLFVPNSFFDGMFYVFAICSALFLLIQIVVWLETSYRINAKLVDGSEPNIVLLIIVCVIFLGGALTIYIFDIVYFKDYASLSGTMYLVVGIAFGLTVAHTVLAALFDDATLTASAIIGAVIALNATLALLSYASSNGLVLQHNDFGVAINSIGIALLFFTAFFGAISLISLSALFGAAGQPYEEFDGYGSDDDEIDSGPSYAYYGFHLVCAFVAAALSLFLAKSTYAFDTWRFYVFAVSTLVGALLYVWTLVAPKLFPDRAFGSSA